MRYTLLSLDFRRASARSGHHGDQDSIRKTYAKKGEEIVRTEPCGVDQTLANLHEVNVPDRVEQNRNPKPVVGDAPRFCARRAWFNNRRRGDCVPVSALRATDRSRPHFAMGKRNLAAGEVPVWDRMFAIQCNKCVVCPHAVIRSKVYMPSLLDCAPATFKSREARLPDWRG
jgi:pyruvate-ferredoxin/flavodoxin oxidoreductase